MILNASDIVSGVNFRFLTLAFSRFGTRWHWGNVTPPPPRRAQKKTHGEKTRRRRAHPSRPMGCTTLKKRERVDLHAHTHGFCFPWLSPSIHSQCPDDVSDSKLNFERKKGEDCRSGDHPARRRENKKHKNLSFRPLCVAYENMPNINMMLSDIWQKISARAPSNFILFHSLSIIFVFVSITQSGQTK